MNRFNELMTQAKPDWDQAAKSRVYNLAEVLDVNVWNVIPVFGGALWATPAIQAGDWDGFLSGLKTVVKNCKLHLPTLGIKKALDMFCNVCLVDPKLVEAYLQTSFEEIAALYE